jgi:glycosyltransferase involved in cell wall biosynthesis
VLCDLEEEQWPSMDLVANMLIRFLRLHHRERVDVVPVRPALKRRFSRLPLCRERRAAHNADRLINRYWDYPHCVARELPAFDVYHVIDHSYSQLVHRLPATRTVVTCHDLDTFRCVLDPVAENRPAWFKEMSRHTLDGLRKAAHVACVSASTRSQLLDASVVAPERASVVWNGVRPECSGIPDAEADQEAACLLGPASQKTLELLNVGSTASRKRITTLLELFANIRRQFPSARLIRIGGALTADQARLAEELGVLQAVQTLPFISGSVLAAIYRRAALVLQPSEREGFGLPVAEAMACGAVVVASLIPALVEVGGSAAAYCRVADIDGWTETTLRLLEEREQESENWRMRHDQGLQQASQFTWSACAAKMAALYRDVYQ